MNVSRGEILLLSKILRIEVLGLQLPISLRPPLSEMLTIFGMLVAC